MSLEARGDLPTGESKGARGAMELERARACLRAASDPLLSELQRDFRDEIDRFLAEHGPVALTRRCLPGHLTASCLLWSHDGTRVLLHHHRKLGLWLQFGGHCDGEGDTREVALRETQEESGIDPTSITETPVDFDVHTIPALNATAIPILLQANVPIRELRTDGSLEGAYLSATDSPPQQA